MPETAALSRLMTYQDAVALIFLFLIPIVTFVICFYFSKKMFQKKKFSNIVQILIALIPTILLSIIILLLFTRVFDFPGKIASFLVSIIPP
jgi:hypothetical protein